MFKKIKKNASLIIVVLFLFTAFVFYPKEKNNITNFVIENKTYKLLTADSPNEWTKGLMNIKKLKNADGMIFIFPDKQFRTFWNKNTLLNLEVYWIIDKKVIGKSYLPLIEKSKEIIYINSPAPVNKVVELIKK